MGLRPRGARLRQLVDRRDPLPALVALVSLAVYLAHGVHGALSRDLSIYVYAGQRIVDGSPPYVDVLNRSGPIAQLMPALGVALGRLFGISDVVGARLLFMAVAIAAVVAVYFLCRALFCSRMAGLAGAAAMLSFHGFIQYAADGPREKTVMVLFLVLFLLELQRRHWFRAGVWLSLATLTLQIIFPPGAGVAVVALILAGRGQRLRGLLRFAVGGLVPVAVFVVYFAAVGALREAYEAYWVINANYTQADPPLHNAQAIWDNISGSYGASLWVSFVGLTVVLVAAGFALLSLRWPAEAPLVQLSRSLAPFGAGALCGVLWSLHDFDGWPDAFPLLPLAAVGVAALIALAVARLPARAAVAVAIVWTLAATANAAVFTLTVHNNELDVERAVTAAMDRHLPADATFFTVQSPEPMALGHHALISRYIMYSAGLENYVDDTFPGGLDGLGRWVARQRPTVITVQRTYPLPQWIIPVLHREYRSVSNEPWRTYVLRSVGERVLKAMRGDITGAYLSGCGSDASRSHHVICPPVSQPR